MQANKVLGKDRFQRMRFCFHVYSFKGNVGVSPRDTKFFYEFEAVSLHSFAGTSSDLYKKLGVLALHAF